MNPLKPTATRAAINSLSNTSRLWSALFGVLFFAAGSSGAADNLPKIQPPGGVLLGPGVAVDPAAQIVTKGNVKATYTDPGLQFDFAGGADASSVTFQPASALWNLGDYLQVVVKVKNSGSTPVNPAVRLDSLDTWMNLKSSEAIKAGSPIAPGESADIVIPFAPAATWKGVDEPDVMNKEIKKDWYAGQPGTGTSYASNRTSGITFLLEEGAGSGSLQVLSITANNPQLVLPEGLGSKPPVEGEWSMTFEDNFDGTVLDPRRWDIYSENHWDKRTHFSKDNVIVKDGLLKLRLEKKTGPANDDPAAAETDYATGFAQTFGRWTQRYGYFEARVKLPKANCMWPAFWLMPDRGLKAGPQWVRSDTGKGKADPGVGGMEMDIVEYLSAWGHQRYNVAFHWDGYQKAHKTMGTSAYVQADKDGYIVGGLLWTPGQIIAYGNGKEIARWESPRISDVQAHMILTNVTGGWETDPIDDKQLPADFTVDWIRVWQRSDLASGADGFHEPPPPVVKPTLADSPAKSPNPPPVAELPAVTDVSNAKGETVPGVAPLRMFDPTEPKALKRLALDQGNLAFDVDKYGINVAVGSGEASYPGLIVKPPEGTVWDLSPYGHVEALITNTGDSPLSITMRVDNDGNWQSSPFNAESIDIKPGASANLKVIFGYTFGYKPGYPLKSEAVSRLLFFMGKVKDGERRFRIDYIAAGGARGEAKPESIRLFPEGGVIVGKTAKLNPATQIVAKGGAQASLVDNNAVKINFVPNADQSVSIQPPAGTWNFKDCLQVKVKLKNVGANPANPKVAVSSRGGRTDLATLAAPLAPGAEGEIVASFIPAKPWVGSDKIVAWTGGLAGTGTKFASNFVNNVSILSSKSEAADQSLLVTSIVAGMPEPKTPGWLGKRPPVDGDWKLTFEDNFDASALDYKRWNIYTANYWDSSAHFTKDNVILKDGKLTLRYEKKTGFHNDDPNGKKTDFATGFADTYGKWTQRYGYFEARLKSPNIPGQWTAFWLMPDRGIQAGPQWKRASTDNGGMEFDIYEPLTLWGPWRYNVAMHFDGYEKNHKSIGNGNTYGEPDKDGYLTVGLLWLPGQVIYYCNGKEVNRWDNERISAIQSYIILDHVAGGWEYAPKEIDKYPADFDVDYVRVWQRKDLATPEDGPKPNSGNPKADEAPEPPKPAAK